MSVMFKRMFRNFRPASPVPQRYQQVFSHLYQEIAWFGVLSGTTIAFLAVYATRQGATNEQIGLLSAVPALVNLLFALPAGSWLSRRSIGRAVFWSSVLSRMFYLLLVPLPILLMPKEQVWVIIATTFVMTIPGTAMVVGFNSLFGEVVPVEWRGHVVGIRNALLAIITTILTLISGFVLNLFNNATGYQIVFAVGVLGAAMSSLHLLYLSRLVNLPAQAPNGGEAATPTTRRLAAEIRSLTNRGLQSLRIDTMRGKFARIMWLLFFWYLAQFMTIPIVTPFIIKDLQISDSLIGLAGGLFNGTMFVGSLMLNRATLRFGNKQLTGFGIMGLSLFPLLTAAGVLGFIFANITVGFAWAMAGGALYNYILENVPADDRPAHLAWYSLISNAAILLGSLAGPVFAGVVGYVPALIIFGIGRFLAGAALLRWG